MKVIIIEDELSASGKLKAMLKKIEPAAEVITVIESVKESIKWINSNSAPDAAFVDIQLADDLSFEIFKNCNVNFPVIFTTAFDEYIMEAFEYNSIDYILKPVTEDRLKKALQKIKVLEWHFFNNRVNKLFEQRSGKTRERFLVKKGLDYVSVSPVDIAYFFSEHKLVFLKDINSNKYLIDKALTEIYNELDSSKFFRLNRQYIVNINAIENFRAENPGKLLVKLKPPAAGVVVISKENAPAFRKWINR